MGRGTSNESGLKQAIQAGQSRRNRVTENISPKQAGEGQSQIEPEAGRNPQGGEKREEEGNTESGLPGTPTPS